MIEVLITAVSERADLFERTVASMLPRLGAQARLMVHEDVRPGSRPGVIAAQLRTLKATAAIDDYGHIVRDPARGLGLAALALLRAATQPIVLFTNEDWDFVRDVPVPKALDLMERHGLHHIAFGKCTTPAAKHAGQPDEWRKVEVEIGGQKVTIAQSWRSHASLWRVAQILPFFEALERDPEADRWAMIKVNRAMNRAHLGDEHGNDQMARHEKLKTYLWGGIGEPAFIAHTGGGRRSEIQSIGRYGAPS